MASKKFNIDDAFDSDEDEKIRTYGSTTSSRVFRPKKTEKDEEMIKTTYSRIDSTTSESGALLSDDAEAGTNVPTNILQFEHSRLSFSSTNDSLSVQTKTFPEKFRWYKHPKIRENWKIVLASVVLLVVGIGLIIAGILVEVHNHSGVQSFVFFIAGGICFIPGVYHVVYICCAVRGRAGFSFYNLPVFK